MNITAILYAVVALGGLSLAFALVLSFADKKFAVPVDERVSEVRAALPGANCGACGYAGCDVFAQAVVDGQAKANGCIPGGASSAKAIGDVMGVEVTADKPMIAKVVCQGEVGVSKHRYDYDGYESCRMASMMAGGPKKCPYACVGLGDCVKVCAFGALTVENGLARVDETKCTACGMCASICPRHSIQLKPKNSTVMVRCQNRDTGRQAREECQKACIACKRCQKECKYDAIVIEDGYAKIDPDKCTRCGACAKVCPCGCITMSDKK